MSKKIRTDSMSRVSKSSKTYGAHIKVSEDATDSAPKPYLGYRRGRGMPSAREPIEELSEQGRKNFDKYFGHEGDKLIGNAKPEESCPLGWCEYYDGKKGTNCCKFPFDISKCGKRYDHKICEIVGKAKKKREQRTKKKSRKRKAK
jgi:hypothetical protein